eukprot:SAG11_NODE_8651_length_991_cov_0.928251_2_plen_156_part_01
MLGRPGKLDANSAPSTGPCGPRHKKTGWDQWSEADHEVQRQAGIVDGVTFTIRSATDARFLIEDCMAAKIAPEQFSEERRRALVEALALKTLQKRMRVVHFGRLDGDQVVSLQKKVAHEIKYADPRNKPGERGWLELNTWSSRCMYPVLKRHVAAV